MQAPHSTPLHYTRLTYILHTCLPIYPNHYHLRYQLTPATIHNIHPIHPLQEDKLGIRASSTGTVTLEDVEVAGACLLGPEGAGFKVRRPLRPH